MSLHPCLRPRFGPLDRSNLKQRKNTSNFGPINKYLHLYHGKIPKVVNLRLSVHTWSFHSRFSAGCPSACLPRRRENVRLPKFTENIDHEIEKIPQRSTAKILIMAQRFVAPHFAIPLHSPRLSSTPSQVKTCTKTFLSCTD